MEKWYQGIYRRQLTDMHISDAQEEFLSHFNADEYYENLVKAQIQSPMIYLQSHTGLCNFPTSTARTHRKFVGEHNEIKRLIEKCRAGGMKVVGYYSLIFNNWAADNYPIWEMRDREGKSWRERGQRYGLCCPNRLEYRAFVRKQIQEIASYFGELDGIFYDMPYWEVVCTCDACRARWKSETGCDFPETEDFGNQNWLRFVRKRQDWMAEFVRYVREVSMEILPRTTVEFNFAAVVGCNWLGGSTEDINSSSEFTGGDLYGDLYNHSFTCKYYYGITKNQPFEYMTCRCDRLLREHTVTKPLAQLESEILLTAAHHGASLIIDAIDPIGTLDSRVYERIGKVFEKQIPYERYMDKGELYAEVAVYFDSRTQFPAEHMKICNKDAAIHAVRTLTENHIPVAVIANGNLDEVDKYPMVIAPLLQNFENDEILRLIKYVREGGTLYLSGKSDERLTKEFFDAKVEDYTYGNSAYLHVEKGYDEVQAYLSPMSGYEFGEFNENYPMPISYKLPVLKSAKGEVRAFITLPYTDPDDNTVYAAIHSNPPGRRTDLPAILETSYGRGKVIWSAAALESDLRESIQQVFVGIVHKYIPMRFKISASKFVEIVIFADPDFYYISFIDLCVDTAAPLREYTIRGECSLQGAFSRNSFKIVKKRLK